MSPNPRPNWAATTKPSPNWEPPPNPAQTGQSLVSSRRWGHAAAPRIPRSPFPRGWSHIPRKHTGGNQGGCWPGEIMNMDGGTDPAPDYSQGSLARVPCSHWKSRVPLEHPDLHPRRFWPCALHNLPCEVDEGAATSSIPKGFRASQIPDPAPARLPGSEERIWDMKKNHLPPGAASGRTWQIIRHNPGLVLSCEDASADPADVQRHLSCALLQQGLSPGPPRLCHPAAGTVPRDAVPVTFIPVPKPAGTRGRSWDFGRAVTFQT